VVTVDPQQPERDLVRDGLARDAGPGIEQDLDRPGMAFGRRMAGRPIGIAAAGDMAFDVEQVLDREGQPGQRPIG
jgi:hypothetical protein